MAAHLLASLDLQDSAAAPQPSLLVATQRLRPPTARLCQWPPLMVPCSQLAAAALHLFFVAPTSAAERMRWKSNNIAPLPDACCSELLGVA